MSVNDGSVDKKAFIHCHLVNSKDLSEYVDKGCKQFSLLAFFLSSYEKELR